jgi:hypothetical protein
MRQLKEAASEEVPKAHRTSLNSRFPGFGLASYGCGYVLAILADGDCGRCTGFWLCSRAVAREARSVQKEPFRYTTPPKSPTPSRDPDHKGSGHA